MALKYNRSVFKPVLKAARTRKAAPDASGKHNKMDTTNIRTPTPANHSFLQHSLGIVKFCFPLHLLGHASWLVGSARLLGAGWCSSWLVLVMVPVLVLVLILLVPLRFGSGVS